MTEKRLAKFANKLVRFEMQLFKHSVESRLITGVVSISPTKSVVVRDNTFEVWDDTEWRFVFK